MEEEKTDEKKKQIIEWLNKLGRLSTSRFVGILGINYELVKKYLEELEINGKIIREEETNSTYWILNKGCFKNGKL